MKNIYLVRHGQTVSNAGGMAVKNPEIPLTDLGHTQAQDVAHWLSENVAHIDGVLISPFIRTYQTAQPLLDMTGMTPHTIEGMQEFNYICFSNIDGVPASERHSIADNYWQTATPDFIDGGNACDAESFSHLQTRIEHALSQFKDLADGTYVAYTHGLWLAMLQWRLLGLPTHSAENMQCFRRFEQAMKIRNTDVFQLQLHDAHLPAITKVRTAPKS